MLRHMKVKVRLIFSAWIASSLYGEMSKRAKAWSQSFRRRRAELVMRDKLSVNWGPNGASLRRVMSGPVMACTAYIMEVPMSLSAATASSRLVKSVGNCKDGGDVIVEVLELFMIGYRNGSIRRRGRSYVIWLACKSRREKIRWRVDTGTYGVDDSVKADWLFEPDGLPPS